MTKMLEAKPIIDNKIQYLKNRCGELSKEGLTPKMHVILVGNNPASLLYVKNKEKMCHLVGAKFELVKLDDNIDKETFISHINKMNNDPTITGCFVQLPIPKQLQSIDVTSLINPIKDIDGFGGNSIVDIYKNFGNSLLPCTPKGILELFKFYNIDIESKHIVVIGRSLIVGKPISLLLTNKNATVTTCHSKTKDIKKHTKEADIIISAVGQPKFLTSDYFKDDQSQIVIDVGISKDRNNKTVGDADFQNIKNKLMAISPVPGGVGPLTVLSLIENLILATENILKKEKR